MGSKSPSLSVHSNGSSQVGLVARIGQAFGEAMRGTLNGSSHVGLMLAATVQSK